MKLLIFLLFLSSFFIPLLFCNGCKEQNCPPSLLYLLPYTISPVQDTFQLGDTIWIEMNFGDVLTDSNGNIQNTFSDYDFRLELVCGRFDIDPPQSTAVSFFDTQDFIGTSEPVGLPQSGVSYYKMFPKYQERFYRLKTALILKETGSFLLSVTPFQWRGEPFKIVGVCDQISVKIWGKANNGNPEENNFYLLQSSPVEVYRNIHAADGHASGYCYIVQ